MRPALRYVAVALLACAVVGTAQPGDITGRVVDTTDTPIAGVRVMLRGSGTVAYTDTLGQFRIPGTLTGRGGADAATRVQLSFAVRRGVLAVRMPRAGALALRLYDPGGRSVAAGVWQWLDAGEQRVSAPGVQADGMYVADIRTDEGTWRVRVMVTETVGRTMPSAQSRCQGTGVLARRLAIDSLVVSKAGYNTERLAVDTFPNDYPRIVLRADAIEWRVDSLLALMTAEEKTGQMIQADMVMALDSGDVRTLLLGSVIAGVASPVSPAPGDWATRSDAVQAQAAQTRFRIPVLQGTDAVHGHNNCRGAVIFPHNIGMGCLRSPELVRQAWEITAREAAGTGVNWTFGPCIAVPRDERWGRTYEGFGETSGLADSMAAAGVLGTQGAGTFVNGAIAACVKHYLADGGTAWGSGRNGMIDQGEARGGEALLRTVHLPGYISAVRAGVFSVMVQYGSWAKPDTAWPEDFHGSHFWITKVLKREYGFDGIVLTDCQGYGTIDMRSAVADTLQERIRVAINAGVDMLMACDGYRQVLPRLRALVHSGQIPTARVNDAVRRILRVKYRLGLFDRATVDRAKTAQVGSPAHRAVARQCVQRSCVLLKNANARLPLRKSGQRIAVVGFHADSVSLLCGGWSMGWSTAVEPIVGTTILDGIKALVNDTNNLIISSNGTGIAAADIAVIVSGETPYAEWTGDNSNPRLPVWTRTMITNCVNAGKPVVLVLISGRPLLLETYEAQCDAILAAWLPGTEAHGVADVLFGDVAPSGKLSHSWPRNLAQIPINVGDSPYDPLYPYGHGLTY